MAGLRRIDQATQGVQRRFGMHGLQALLAICALYVIRCQSHRIPGPPPNGKHVQVVGACVLSAGIKKCICRRIMGESRRAEHSCCG